MKGCLLPKVSVLDSNKVVLKEETFGLNLIFNCLTPSNKNACSKSAVIGCDKILCENNLSLYCWIE